MSGVVQCVYTNGVGNNIFQYVFSRLLAEHHGLKLSCPGLSVLGVENSLFEFDRSLPVTRIELNELDYQKYFDMDSNRNFFVYTYAEDYTIYKPHLEKIRSWFEDVPKTNEKDLVFYLRLGDRLVSKNDYVSCMKIEAEEYVEAFKMFDYEKLYIVTDMNVWREITPEEVNIMAQTFHNIIPFQDRVPAKVSADYFNSLVDGFSNLSPIIRFGKNMDDNFRFLRSFDKIMFQHGTFGWWAATLSHASRVGVFGPWRPVKGDRNKNLGKTDFPGWFQWGLNRKR